MKKYIKLLFLFALLSAPAFSQVCESNKELGLDLNTITTKCAVIDKWEDSKNVKKQSRQIAVKLSSRRRVIRKRAAKANGLALKTNTVNKINSSKASVSNLIKNETEIDDSVIMPYSAVMEKPTFFDCKDASDAKCFTEQMSKHIKKHFSYPQEAYEKNIEGKVIVRFTINKYGEIEKIKSSSSHENEILKKEADRIIGELPRLKPAKQVNKLVNVNYGVTINFKINDNVRKQYKSSSSSVKNAISFDKVQEIPLFESCKGVDDKAKLNCFNEEMVNHIQKNFSYPKLAAKNNISGKVWVNFVIGTNGLISNIKMKAPSNSYLLKSEAKRIISLLPKFTPGKLNGKEVNTKYTLPINFVLE